MTERMLITKIVRTSNGHADLYARGHRYPDLKLFDLSDLADVGIDFESLPVGQEKPCRFYAHYEFSKKLNQDGNPYKDVVMLEPIDRPATAASTDTSALLAELREITGEMRAVRALLSEFAGRQPGSPPPRKTERAPAQAQESPSDKPDPDDLDTWFPRPDEDQAAAPAPAAAGPADVPMSSEALLAHLNREGELFQSVGHLLYGIRKHSGDSRWGWPITTDREGWGEAARLALAYAENGG